MDNDVAPECGLSPFTARSDSDKLYIVVPETIWCSRRAIQRSDRVVDFISFGVLDFITRDVHAVLCQLGRCTAEVCNVLATVDTA